MLRRGWIGIALLVPAAVFIAVLPLRLVVGEGDIIGDDIGGSIWRGHIGGASWHGIDLGDLETRAGLWPPGLEFDGNVVRGRLTPDGIENLSGSIDDFAGLPLTQISLDGVTVGIDAKGCRHARGLLAVVATPLPQLGALSGPISCDNGVMRAVLRPDSGDARLDLSLDRNRRYRATLAVGGLPILVRSLLLAAGFETTETGVALTRDGQL